MDSLTTEEAAVAGGMLGAFFAMAIVFYVLLVIAGWKIFKKAGIAGWKSLIPIYNVYLIYKLSGIKQWFWYSIIISVVLSIIINMAGGMQVDDNGNMVGNPSALAVICAIASLVIGIAISIYANYKLAKAFGKGVGFTIGLILLPNIFTLILGFGSAKYDKKVLKD